jgi:hypothetical protein
MASINTVGTPRGCSYSGISFRVKADASISEMLRKYNDTVIPSSGEAMVQRAKAVQGLSGFPFTTNQRERNQLDTLADSGPHKFVYTDAAEVTISGQAVLAGDSIRTSDEGTYTADVQFMDKPTLIYP